MGNPLFLLGAGFNRDAGGEAGTVNLHSIYGKYQKKFEYPLASDLLEICFGKEAMKEGISVEECFAEALEKKNYDPLRHLCDTLMECDYRLIPLLLPDGGNQNNCYVKFFNCYEGSSFLTFNYDSLPEVFLHRMGQWYPHDGYGVRVKVETQLRAENNDLVHKSSNLVLHLHGSLCIYTSDFDLITTTDPRFKEIRLREKPDYFFDPESISLLFPEYRTPFTMTGYEPIELRVIAPIPNKVEGLKQKFIADVYSRALQLISETDKLIAIGYDFSPLDKVSYDRLLVKFSNQDRPQVLLVGPNASRIEKRLRNDYPRINWLSVSKNFKSWVEDGFPMAACTGR
jgi:hypothetical protein